MAGRFSAALLLLVGCAFGYGGFEFGGSFVDYAPEARRLSELNREWEGAGEFRPSLPTVWFGGHAGGHAGPVTVGGRGAVTFRSLAADAIEVQFGGAQVALDLGWHYAPVAFLALRPGVELGGAGWVYYVHDRDTPLSDPDFSRWFVGWTMGATPAFEVMGRLPGGGNRYTGLFIKAGYFLPFYGPAWYYDESPPGFDLKGFNLQLGIRFGRLPPTFLRI